MGASAPPTAERVADLVPANRVISAPDYETGHDEGVRFSDPDRGWFASFSAFSTHVILSFVADSSLDPRPPSGTAPDGQALDVAEGDALDEDRVASWVRQAAEEPGMNW